MEALLDAPPSNQLCDSVRDLQDRLRNLLSAKVSETRAEHISASFELPSTATFTINEAEHEAAASSIDPLLASARTAIPSNDQSTRHISASETLINQPQNDPILQRTVSKHIVTAVGAADEAHWTVRQVSRVDQGWTFTYICKSSSQAWNRQHAKQAVRAVAGDTQDLVHMGTNRHVVVLFYGMMLIAQIQVGPRSTAVALSL